MQKRDFCRKIPKVYVFNGSKEIRADGFLSEENKTGYKWWPGPGTRDGHLQDNVARFLLPASECEFDVDSVYICS